MQDSEIGRDLTLARAEVDAECREQGLPVHVTDHEALAKLAALILESK
jgi:hypothetical protein